MVKLLLFLLSVVHLFIDKKSTLFYSLLGSTYRLIKINK